MIRLNCIKFNAFTQYYAYLTAYFFPIFVFMSSLNIFNLDKGEIKIYIDVVIKSK
jgi:hypothetical protein